MYVSFTYFFAMNSDQNTDIPNKNAAEDQDFNGNGFSFAFFFSYSVFVLYCMYVCSKAKLTLYL